MGCPVPLAVWVELMDIAPLRLLVVDLRLQRWTGAAPKRSLRSARIAPLERGVTRRCRYDVRFGVPATSKGVVGKSILDGSRETLVVGPVVN